MEREKKTEELHSFKERHLMFGDTQYPDVDEEALQTVLNLNKDFKATHVWLMGDMLNATTLSKFGHPADYHFSFWDEIRGTREMLEKIVESVRKVNPSTKITYLEGNHCFRLQKYIDKNADQLAELKDARGDRVLSMEKLLELKEMDIKWVPYWEDEKVTKDVTTLHGNLARIKSGYTAHAYIDKYGKSVIAGHTHRLGLIFKTQSGEVKFGIETGSLCKRKMKVPYGRENQLDWQQGFALLGIDSNGKAHPAVIPIVDGKAGYGGKVYRGDGEVRRLLNP